MDRRGFTLLELLTSVVIMGLFSMGIMAVYRSAEGAHRAGLVRGPLGLSAHSVRTHVRDQVRQAACLDTPGVLRGDPGSRLSGSIGADCSGNNLCITGGPRYFLFCFDSPRHRLLLQRGAGAAPASCDPAQSSVISGVFVEADGTFTLSSASNQPNKVILDLRLQVPFSDIQKSRWSEEPFTELHSTFTAGGVVQDPPPVFVGGTCP